MGRLIYALGMSLDGYVVDTAGRFDWSTPDEEAHRLANEEARDTAALLFGRRMFETMEGFWPQARDDDSLPDYLREYGEIWTSMPKVLVSRTRTHADHNTQVVHADDAVGALAELRARTDGDLGVGGATLATALLRAGLLDELLLFTHPVILGTGRPLFDGHDEPLQLDLLEQARYDEGVTMHRYAVRNVRP